MRCRHLIFVFILILSSLCGAAAVVAAPKIDPELASRLKAAQQSTQLFGVILTFNSDRITDAQVTAVSALGIRTGVRMANFPIMAVNATPSQITQMLRWDSLRSIYLNAPINLYLNQTRPLIGVTRLRQDPEITRRNGGAPVSGRGVTIAINDTGVDGTHQDLQYDPLNPAAGKTIQNVIVNPNDKDGLVLRTDQTGNLVEGILPPSYIENVITSDTNGAHGTHVASIAAGSGLASGGLYQGIAPGSSILGLGSGGGLFILGQIQAFDYAFTNQFRYNVRVINCSWGNSAVAADPDHPINVASRKLYELAHIVVVFANGNDGAAGPNSQNRWASVPWVLATGASDKRGRIANFSSRGIFGDTVVHPTILAPGTGGPTAEGFTSAVIAARSRNNATANGLNADAEIPPAFLPNYTQISGTSMAAPHLAGVVANVLSANPSLLPEDVRTVLERTATPLGVYDVFEAGAGLANVHAAVDLALNPQKPYGNFGFTGKGLALTKQDGGVIDGVVASNASNPHNFSVPANTLFTFVQLEWGAAAGEDQLIVDNTKLAANDLDLTVRYRDPRQTAPSQQATADQINLGGLFGSRETVKLEFPAEGSATADVNSGLAGLGNNTDQPYRLTITHYLYDPNEAGDLAGVDTATRIKALRLVYDRMMFTEAGAFRPDQPLSRMEMARALMFGARVMQYIPNQPSFTDIAAATPDALVVESLKREGVMGTKGSTFGPTAAVTRVDEAVALVRALRLTAQADALKNSDVKVGGQTITDNAKIPAELRGYVQLAIDKGLMEAFPASVQQTPTGIIALPGPRFEPDRTARRAEFVGPMTRLLSLLFGE
ncbi:MAG TPA: S8 family serine peptidase [Pyrinomonadaceae bacterium]|jgi:serine protease AprX|nr:S8 family serine peptidase [Pyrinomonadaceae bacterium]